MIEFYENNSIDLSKGKRLFKDNYWIDFVDGDYIYITNGFDVELHTLEKGRLNKEQYTYIGNFDGDLAPAKTSYGYPCVINKSGDTIIKLTHTIRFVNNNYEINGNFVFVRGTWLDKNKSFYSNFSYGDVYNSNGDRLIKCSSIVSTKGNLAVISQVNSKILINFNGKKIYKDSKFEDLIIINDDTILVKKKNNMFVINGLGKKKKNIDLSNYDFEKILSDNTILFISKRTKDYIVMDNEFNIIATYSNKNDVPLDNLNKDIKNKQVVSGNYNRKSLLDENGNVIIDFVDHNIIPFKDKVFIDNVLMEYDDIKINYNLSFRLYGEEIQKTFNTLEERAQYKKMFESYISDKLFDIDKRIEGIVKEKEKLVSQAKLEAVMVVNNGDKDISKKLVKKFKESDK